MSINLLHDTLGSLRLNSQTAFQFVLWMTYFMDNILYEFKGNRNTLNRPINRLNITGHMDNNNDALVIITRESLNLLLRENSSLQQKMLEINQNVERTLERLAVVMETTSQQATRHNSTLNKKLDTLINIVSKNTIKPDINIDAILEERTKVLKQKCRSEKLSGYYEELLNEDSPFVRKEFRTRVNENTPEYELKHRRQHSINKVKTEILILEDRVTRCTEKQKQLDSNIREYLETEVDQRKRERIQSRVEKEESQIHEDYINHQMAFFKRFDSNEKETIPDFLTKIADGNSKRKRKLRNSKRKKFPPKWNTKRNRSSIPIPANHISTDDVSSDDVHPSMLDICQVYSIRMNRIQRVYYKVYNTCI